MMNAAHHRVPLLCSKVSNLKPTKYQAGDDEHVAHHDSIRGVVEQGRVK